MFHYRQHPRRGAVLHEDLLFQLRQGLVGMVERERARKGRRKMDVNPITDEGTYKQVKLTPATLIHLSTTHASVSVRVCGQEQQLQLIVTHH